MVTQISGVSGRVLSPVQIWSNHEENVFIYPSAQKKKIIYIYRIKHLKDHFSNIAYHICIALLSIPKLFASLHRIFVIKLSACAKFIINIENLVRSLKVFLKLA